jgi:predicted Fe-Mo cluster-binding NifX family protein
MKLAVSYWQGRISPVFDVSRYLLVVELESWVEKARFEVVLRESDSIRRAKQLEDLGVEVLICGAVSRDMEAALRDSGVIVKRLVRGEVDEVLAAYCTQSLEQERFKMPGSLGHGRSAGRRNTH